MRRQEKVTPRRVPLRSAVRLHRGYALFIAMAARDRVWPPCMVCRFGRRFEYGPVCPPPSGIREKTMNDTHNTNSNRAQPTDTNKRRKGRGELCSNANVGAFWPGGMTSRSHS